MFLLSCTNSVTHVITIIIGVVCVYNVRSSETNNTTTYNAKTLIFVSSKYISLELKSYVSFFSTFEIKFTLSFKIIHNYLSK